jgi:hypothetical protein
MSKKFTLCSYITTVHTERVMMRLYIEKHLDMTRDGLSCVQCEWTFIVDGDGDCHTIRLTVHLTFNLNGTRRYFGRGAISVINIMYK